MSEYFLEAKGISKAFGGIQALKNVNLNVRHGESVCMVGENGCGKSTLIKIISGAYVPDSGEIIIEGVSHSQMTPLLSTHAGIQVIYQDFSLFHNLTVAENIAMPYNISRNQKQLFSKSKNIDIAKAEVEKIGVPIDLKAMVDDLPIAQRQIVAICRALVQDAKLIIMDEPTTTLTNKEVEALYRIIDNLRSRGISLLFVSHKLHEVFMIAERIVIIRNGENVIEGPITDFDMKKVSYYMTGKEQSSFSFDNKIDEKNIIFSSKGLTAKDNAFRNIDFNLYKGEVLGITGLLGSGRESLAEALFGKYPHTAEKLELCGKPLRIKNPPSAVKEGIGYIPEDRAVKGLYLRASVGDNIMSSLLFHYHRLGFLFCKKLRNVATEQTKKLRIKTDGIDAAVSSLSGGNQQRVVIAKWLALNPKLIVFNCPTVGVDIGSKYEIHILMRKIADEGIGVILISDDLPEILSVCNRVLVMSQGEIVKSFQAIEVSEDTLYQCMNQS